MRLKGNVSSHSCLLSYLSLLSLKKQSLTKMPRQRPSYVLEIYQELRGERDWKSHILMETESLDCTASRWWMIQRMLGFPGRLVSHGSTFIKYSCWVHFPNLREIPALITVRLVKVQVVLTVHAAVKEKRVVRSPMYCTERRVCWEKMLSNKPKSDTSRKYSTAVWKEVCFQ